MVPLSQLRSDFEAGRISKSDFIDRAAEVHRGLFGVIDSLDASGINRIELSAEGVLYEVSGTGAKFAFRKFDKRIAPIESLNFGPYEPEIMRILSWLVTAIPGPIFDIGANIGWYSVQLARQYPQRPIVAFEPSPTTFNELQCNAELNELKNVALVNSGLGQRRSQTFLADTTEMSGAAHVSDVPTEKPIDINTLDDYCAEKQIWPGIVKADVEGYELFVLKGASRVLKGGRPAWVLELLRKWAARFGYHPNDALALMREVGYRSYAIGDTSLRPIDKVTEQTEEKNFLFLHPDVHDHLIAEVEREA